MSEAAKVIGEVLGDLFGGYVVARNKKDPSQLRYVSKRFITIWTHIEDIQAIFFDRFHEYMAGDFFTKQSGNRYIQVPGECDWEEIETCEIEKEHLNFVPLLASLVGSDRTIAGVTGRNVKLRHKESGKEIMLDPHTWSRLKRSDEVIEFEAPDPETAYLWFTGTDLILAATDTIKRSEWDFEKK